MVEGGRGRAFDEGEERDGIGGKKSWGMSAELAQDGYTREFLLEKKRRWREFQSPEQAQKFPFHVSTTMLNMTGVRSSISIFNIGERVSRWLRPSLWRK